MENTTTHAAPSSPKKPGTATPLESLLHYGPDEPEARLHASLRKLKSLTLALLNLTDEDTFAIQLEDKDYFELIVLAVDLAEKALKETEEWSDLELAANCELINRADQLPKDDELWIKCNIIADRPQTTLAEQAAAVNLMISQQIKPVIVNNHDGTKTTFELYNPQVRIGWHPKPEAAATA